MMSKSKQEHREAIVTLITGDIYIPGALVLGYSLNKYNSVKVHNRDMIALIKHDSINDKHHLKMLEEIGWKLIYVDSLSFPGTVIPRLADGLIKLYAWNMTQYSTILVLDADVMIIGSIEEPLRIMRRNKDIPLLAVNFPFSANKSENKTFLTSYFNAGVLFLRPNAEDYKKLIHLSSINTYYHLKYPQQNLLNTYFLGRWLALSIIYNYTHRNSIWITQKNNIRIVHFAGKQKPWQKLNNTNYNDNDQLWHETDFIWQKLFADMIYQYGWQKHHFLSHNASQELRLTFDFNRLSRRSM
ncbi:unnamed protein product [Adineta steineri]|uniref:glycogenin glucosyltransferase n=1 Tax=Adineta steineri TaxID=433720 RepID=A0A819UP09_9BILA|nr:unnamed protein product [Adineta steineri]CAF4098139.1 unnamed protein product [Adineta steineri]